ncbi:Splicing factor 3B subunit 5 [Characodon lateralis]|uniref:Splicing factor 3B subunit 5 n=1 Tax=Characodon lateralis TaxID=208331 RepID=A0ABU7DUV5_9TELE|nr:Splicing factor 3B subunit 5 [Characodon lateralis]
MQLYLKTNGNICKDILFYKVIVCLFIRIRVSNFFIPSFLDTVGLLSARMTDRYNIHSQLEHLQSKYIGTGHADTSKWEWLVNQHRDSYCSYMGHFDLLNYFSVAENESKARVRFNLMEKMLQPCGPPADKPDDA